VPQVVGLGVGQSNTLRASVKILLEDISEIEEEPSDQEDDP